MEARVINVCISNKTGIQKTPVKNAIAKEKHGLAGDAHAGDWHRQISLLANEDAQIMRNKGSKIGPGDFGENILTEGIALSSLPIGTKITIGETILEITQIGKECHSRCAIYHAAGDCVMPKKGIFCKVLQGGEIAEQMLIKQLC